MFTDDAQITLILSIFIINENEHLAESGVFDNVFDRRQCQIGSGVVIGHEKIPDI
jgi:hypothetical protein